MGMGLIVMNQAYEKDYLYIISRRGHKRKFRSIGGRYLAKSLIANCKAEKQMFSYLNFRGSRFARVKFLDTEFKGCDFWEHILINVLSKGHILQIAFLLGVNLQIVDLKILRWNIPRLLIRIYLVGRILKEVII